MSLSKQFTTVTPFSKGVALSLFIVLPFLTFVGGIHYGEQNQLAATLPPPHTCTPVLTPGFTNILSVTPKPTRALKIR